MVIVYLSLWGVLPAQLGVAST